MATPASQWDPEYVLKIGQVSSGVTCVGDALVKQRRCNNPIAAANRKQASALLRRISSLDVSSPSIDAFLKRLGHLLLCESNQHKDQIAKVMAKWRLRIKRHSVKKAAERESVARSGAATSHLIAALKYWLPLFDLVRKSGAPQWLLGAAVKLFRSRYVEEDK